MKTRLFVFLFILAGFFTSCFHKDVMNDPADDIAETILYTGKEGNIVINHELIFQATSKSSGGGMTRISGYNEARLTSYDLETGAVLARIELGEEQETTYELLGVVADKLWLYTTDPELGLHSRNPKTLEVIDKEQTIKSLGPLKLARPGFAQIDQYYAFDADSGALFLTDLQGIRYLLSPADLSVKETERELPREDFLTDILSTNVYFDKDKYIGFTGSSDRKKINWNNQDTAAQIPFINPQVFKDLNPSRTAARRNSYLNKLQSRIDSIRAKLDSLGVKYEEDEIAPREYKWNASDEERERERMITQIGYDYRDAVSDLKHENTFSSDYDEYALGAESKCALIYSAANVEDTAMAQLSLVDCSSQKFTEKWKLSLTGFYYDSDKAEGAGVFEDGDPEFRYKWAEIHNNTFVMIAQLKMIAIDLSTGKKIWEIQL
jgi:hypothetical protein